MIRIIINAQPQRPVAPCDDGLGSPFTGKHHPHATEYSLSVCHSAGLYNNSCQRRIALLSGCHSPQAHDESSLPSISQFSDLDPTVAVVAKLEHIKEQGAGSGRKLDAYEEVWTFVMSIAAWRYNSNLSTEDQDCMHPREVTIFLSPGRQSTVSRTSYSDSKPPIFTVDGAKHA